MTKRQKRLLGRIFGAALLLVAAHLGSHLFLENTPLWYALLLFLPSYLLVGYDVLWQAARRLVRGQVLDENFLMALATLGALTVGFLPSGEAQMAEGVLVMLFYQAGELFQSLAVGKSRRSIAALMEIRPETARVLRDGKACEVLPEEVAVGEVIAIRPGEKIPLDGVILAGNSALSTLALTGEALPRDVGEGEDVISGCTNLTGALTVRVSRAYEDSTVARVLRLIEESGARKSGSERFITRFAKYYTPAVVGSAVALALLPPLFSGQFAAVFSLWLARALSFLVVSCPCALVISVPLAFFGGIGGAARMGVLIKGANYLEALAHADTLVLDKTGTVTEGRFAPGEVCPVGVTREELLRLAAAVEAGSNHPLAKAVYEAYRGEVPPVSELRELAGKGVLANVAGDALAVGSLSLMRELGVAMPAVRLAESAVFVARNGVYIGCILCEDVVRQGAAEAIAALRAQGVARVVMLTGDHAAIAEKVAERVGIDEVHASLLPEGKVREVEALLALPQSGKVCFVGDGINDAPVLSRADVGVAMGALGSDAAIEAADVVLMNDDLAKLPLAVRHARKTLAIVRQNIWLSLGIKGAVLLGCALGAFGGWQMPLAVFADVGVALIAILNAMRTLK